MVRTTQPAAKPELTTLHGSQVTVESLEKLCLRLTGESFTPEERKEAEEIAATYAAAQKAP